MIGVVHKSSRVLPKSLCPNPDVKKKKPRRTRVETWSKFTKRMDALPIPNGNDQRVMRAVADMAEEEAA